MEVTEADVRQYVQDSTSAEDIERAIAVAATLRYSDLPECHILNAALITVAIAQGRTQEHSHDGQTGTDRRLLHRALQRSLRLPR